MNHSQLGGKFAQFGSLIVGAFIATDDAGLLLKVRQTRLSVFQFHPRCLRLIFEPDRIKTGRFSFQGQVHIEIRLRESVGYFCCRIRRISLEDNVDHIAFPGRLDVKAFLQRLNQPCLHGAPTLRGAHPLLFGNRTFFHAKDLDHTLRNAVTGNDVDLRSHVAGRNDARACDASHWVN